MLAKSARRTIPSRRLALRRGEWDFEGDGGSLGGHHVFRYTRAIIPSTTQIGINTRSTIWQTITHTRQMRGGRCYYCLEGHRNIKCAANARVWPSLPMDALNRVGKFPIWRLTLLWIFPRVVPQSIPATAGRLDSRSAIGSRVRVLLISHGTVRKGPKRPLISPVASPQHESGDRGRGGIGPREVGGDASPRAHA
jgi:hypothetical protein